MSGTITDITAYPLSFPVPQGNNVRLGIGRTVKRDTVIVKVVTSEGIVGYGESHHGRAPGAVARLINTTLRDLVLNMEADDVVGVWKRIYTMQLGSHGMGAAASIGMSGIDMALWDIRGKAYNLPLYKLLGGASRPIPAYAGGISLGYQEPQTLVDEARGLVAQGYTALKLRVGDTPANDVARVEAVREALPDVTILVDANTGYTLADARYVMPAYESLRVDWLEEPFPAHDYRNYALASTFSSVPLAAGENHYTRFEFARVIEDGVIQVLQPDLSKTGGITEGLRIAATASTWKLPINPHTSATALNMAATIHFLCAIENSGYFEGDAAVHNPFRDDLTAEKAYEMDSDGFVYPLEKPGIGLEVDEAFIEKHPLIDGPGFV